MTDAATALRTAQAADNCPVWCDILDHANSAGGKGHHATIGEMIELSRYPHDEDPDHEAVIVGLDLEAGDAEPHITLVCRHGDETELTPDEADELAGQLTLMARKCRRAISDDQVVAVLGRALADAIRPGPGQ